MAATSTMLPLGTEAPDFRLPSPNVTMHGPSEWPDAPGLLVAFLCNHCPYVQHVADRLGELTAEWMDKGLATIGVGSNDVAAYPEDGPNRMNGFAGLHGWTFPYVYDETQEVAKAYGAACTPDFFLFARDRRLAYRGQMDGSRPSTDTPVTGEDLDKAVQAVLAGQPVPGEQHPSVGCSIKWKPGNAPDYA